MKGNPRKIKRLEDLIVRQGFSLADVIRSELGMSLSEFARKNQFGRSEVSMTVNAHPCRIYPKIRERLAVRLGVTCAEMDRLIDTFASTRDRK